VSVEPLPPRECECGFCNPPAKFRQHCAHDDTTTISNWDGPLDTFCDLCGREL
jgi:hypothetical protein